MARERRNPTDGAAAPLGVLSIHLSGGQCRVRCPFCYLGQREDGAGAGTSEDDLALLNEEQLAVLLSSLRTILSVQGPGLGCREIAVALSEPVAPVLSCLAAIAAAASAGGLPLTITTTPEVARTHAADLRALPGGVSRISLSIDPHKGPFGRDPAEAVAAIADLAAALRGGDVGGGDVGGGDVGHKDIAEGDGGQPPRSPEIVLIVTLSTPRFARLLFDGLLGALLDLPDIDRVALSAIKPPPPWCDRRFWLQSLAALAPLLRQHLDRRLFLDCYVAARILGIGACPARPDLSPVAGDPAALAFRACVYQPAPDFLIRADGPVAASSNRTDAAGPGASLASRLAGFTPPAVCPFEIP